MLALRFNLSCQGLVRLKGKAALTKQEDGVVDLALLQSVDDQSWESAHIGATMASDFRLVPDASQRDSVKLSTHGGRNGSSQGSLSDL